MLDRKQLDVDEIDRVLNCVRLRGHWKLGYMEHFSSKEFYLVPVESIHYEVHVVRGYFRITLVESTIRRTTEVEVWIMWNWRRWIELMNDVWENDWPRRQRVLKLSHPLNAIVVGRSTMLHCFHNDFKPVDDFHLPWTFSGPGPLYCASGKAR